MAKKLLLVLMLGLSVPFRADAWTLNTWVKSGGGSMTSPNMIGQLSTSGSMFKSYTVTTGTYGVSASANVGYLISNVTVNGVTVASSVPSWSGTLPNGVNGAVYVTFTPIRYTLTATAGTGGSVTPTSLSNLYVGNTASVSFQPISGWNVQAITVTGASGATCNGGSCAGPWATNQRVTVVSTVLASNITVSGTFQGPPTAQAGAGQTVPPGAVVTLDGSGTIGNATSFTWTQSAGPTSVALVATGAQASFVAPTVQGTYGFRLTVQPGGSTSTTSVVVTNDPTGAAYTSCEACHASVGIGAMSKVFEKWASSQHSTQYVMCYRCHVGSNSGGHPGDVGLTTVSPSTFKWLFTTRGYPAGSNFCAQCHQTASQIESDFQASVHSTAPGGPATCSGCHGDAHAASGKVDCFACHGDVSGTVTGHPFLVDGATACASCHDPHTTVPLPSGGHNVHVAQPIACGVCHASVIGIVDFGFSGPAVSPALPPPTFDAAAKTCSNVACHSIPAGTFDYWFIDGAGDAEARVAGYGGGATTPSWYSTEKLGCTGCHDLTYQGGRYVWHSGYHGGSGGNQCQLCHSDALGTATPWGPSSDTALNTASKCGTSGTQNCAASHRDGGVQVTPKFKSSCFGCH